MIVSYMYELYVCIFDSIDRGMEIKRLSDEILKLTAEMEKSRTKLANPQFIEKAPKEIIDKEKTKLSQASRAISVLQEQVRLINGL